MTLESEDKVKYTTCINLSVCLVRRTPLTFYDRVYSFFTQLLLVMYSLHMLRLPI